MPRASLPLPIVQRSSCPSIPPIDIAVRIARSRQRGHRGMVPATTSPRCQTDNEPAMNSTARGDSRLLHEVQQQVTNLLRLLLLHPMPGAFDEMATDHARACGGLHRLEHARTLISAPVLLSRDEAGGHVDCAAGMSLQFGGRSAE